MNDRLPLISIREFYPLALAEGEGMGTAYEYYAKRLVLRPWLLTLTPPKRILVAGLPQRYGLSLDYLQLAAELGATVTVADERPDRVAHLERTLAEVQDRKLLPPLETHFVHVADLAHLSGIDGDYDLVLSSEVLQRIEPAARKTYLERLLALGTAFALFVPNGSNAAHTSHSGLAGVTRTEVNRLLAARPYSLAAPLPRTGYVDLPPFPPGITRSEEQREQATTGLAEAVAVAGLQVYAQLEPWLPQAIRRQHAHIVYALVVQPPAAA